MKRVHVVVRGVVQGVGYRYTAQRRASERGLAGWVRNLRDGSVEAEIEGPSTDVDALLAQLRQGPPGARVDEMTVTDAVPLGEHSFEVRATA